MKIVSALIVALALCSAAGFAEAKTRTPEQVMTHHNAALKAFDKDAFLSDYADDAVAVTARGIFIGKAGIAKLYESFVPFRDAISKMEVTPEYLEDGAVAAHFKINPGTANERGGVDVMVIRKGKIVFQAPQPPPPAPPPSK
jgi:ketosteroid isomerase-like protein